MPISNRYTDATRTVLDRERPHQELFLPALAIIAMVSKVAFLVQREIRPQVSMEIHETGSYYRIIMRWWGETTQLQMNISGNHYGMSIWLHSQFSEHGEPFPHNERLALWHAGRVHELGENYGKLHAWKIEDDHRGIIGLTTLNFDAPCVEYVQRLRQESWSSARFEDDILKTLRLWLAAAGITG